MTEAVSSRPDASDGVIDFRLHTLGWKAFQDLCLHILREVLGQTVQVFPPGNDGGRDGAFRGTWKRSGQETLSGSFTVQCKHTSRPSYSLTVADLATDVEKAKKLVRESLADNYIVLTNASMTASQQTLAEQAFRRVGVNNFFVYDKNWINHTIISTQRLRLLVPRVYGLGDLSEILDDRAYTQAKTLFSSIESELRKFVPTDAYRKAANAIDEHGFVALVGSPGTGKSAIAATLSLYAADTWGTRTIKAVGPEGFNTHWNPTLRDQLFWIDDAFGVTQYDADVTRRWNQYLNHLNAAIRQGTRIVLTSRDYIFERAWNDIKQGIFPLLRDSQVIVRVEDLSPDERDQILYNHVRHGNQSKAVRSSLKPHLKIGARSRRFSPEIARRLGNSQFTRTLDITESGVQNFFEQPMDYLVEILKGLSSNERATLALLFMKSGHLSSPVRLSSTDTDVVQRLGGEFHMIVPSLHSMRNVFTRLLSGDESRWWDFQHPSIRDAIRSIIKADDELLDIYVFGTRSTELFSEVVCGSVALAGEAVSVPQDQYRSVLDRVTISLEGGVSERNQCYSFLSTRCSPTFLRRFIRLCPSFINDHLSVSFGVQDARASLLVTLHSAGILPESVRSSFVGATVQASIEWIDSDILDERFRSIITQEEMFDFACRIHDEIIMNVRSHTEWVSDNVPDDPDQVDFDFEEHISQLYSFLTILEDDGRFEGALAILEEEVERIRDDVIPAEFERIASDTPGYGYEVDDPEDYAHFATRDSIRRDIFDDVDA